MAPALAVEADLDLTFEGQPVAIRGSGEHLTITASSLRGASTVLRNLWTVAKLIGPFGARFVEANLSADVVVAGVVVARIGPHVQPNALSDALGIAPARVWPGAVARVALRELRA